jgi:hypothetical protein
MSFDLNQITEQRRQITLNQTEQHPPSLAITQIRTTSDLQERSDQAIPVFDYLNQHQVLTIPAAVEMHGIAMASVNIVKSIVKGMSDAHIFDAFTSMLTLVWQTLDDVRTSVAGLPLVRLCLELAKARCSCYQPQLAKAYNNLVINYSRVNLHQESALYYRNAAPKHNL